MALTLSIAPTSKTVSKGAVASYEATVTGGSATLSVSGLPVGVEATFETNPLENASTTVTIPTSGIDLGTTSLTLNGEIVSVDPGSTDWLLVDYADRLYDWATYCGIPGGIPTRTTIYAYMTAANSTAEINAAIAACPENQVVYLAAGTYSISQITFARKVGVTLRGAGAGKTILNGTASRMFVNTNGSFTEATGVPISSGYTRGSTSITLSSTPNSYFYAGNLIMLTEANSSDLWGAGIGTYRRSAQVDGVYGLDYTRIFRFTSRIVSVVENVVTLATPIPVGFSAALNPQAYVPQSTTAPTSLCGVEDLTVNGQNSVESKFYINGADRFWVKGVEMKNLTGCDIGHIEFIKCFQSEIRRCFIHDTAGYPNQNDGQGTSFNFGTCNSLIIDSIFDNVAGIVQNNGASANAFLYNYARDITRDSVYTSGVNVNHGGHGMMNLVEGNIMPALKNDGYHGSGSHAVIFRNNVNGLNNDVTPDRKLINLCRGSYYHSVVGNVIGDPSWNAASYDMAYPSPQKPALYCLGFPTTDNDGMTPFTSVAWAEWSKPTDAPDADVAATLLRHGNYDYYNDASVWDGGIASHAVPESLFYSSKPAFFGSLAWPAIGPDVTGLVADIPAKSRWDEYVISADLDDLFADEE